MMKKLLILTFALILGGTASYGAEWNLVYEDNFDREELGENWIHGDNSKIVDGKLHHGINGPGDIIFNKSLPADVKVSMTAESMPGVPPCDLSVSLAGQGETGLKYGYLVGYGAGSNMWHHIIGGARMPNERVEYPDNLIVPGKIYDITATKDGMRISLEANGEHILTTTDQEPLSGPGNDHVGLVTWAGMVVHDVQIYVRSVPNPNTPKSLEPLEPLPLAMNDEGDLFLRLKKKPSAELQKAMNLYNSGELEEAEAAFLKVDDPILSALGVVYTVGHVEYIDDRADNRRAGQMLKDAATDAGQENLALYGEYVSRVGLYNRGESGLAINKIKALGPENNPYYDKAVFYGLRFLRAGAMEGAAHDIMRQVMADLKEMQKKYPNNPSLRELSGERIPWGEEFIIEDETIPEWARASREAYNRQVALLNEWFTNRQFPDGQLGGGWGDDVELLRSWGLISFISDGDPAVRNGIERLAEGMWQSELEEFGFTKQIGDVEHAAEPSADTVPTMMVLRYGDPLWLERNMKTCRTIRDYYMGENDLGMLQFKSSYYGGDQVGQGLPAGGDSMYNVRTMKHFWWHTWYGNKEAERVYLDWAEMWLNRTMLELPDKPAGMIPPHVWYPSGNLWPPEREDATWYTDVGQYMPGGAGAYEMQQSIFLAAYTLTGDIKYLQPMGFYSRWSSRGPLVDRGPNPNPEVGSWGWNLRGVQYGNAMRALPLYWWVSDDESIEEYVLRFPTPMTRYLVTHNLDSLINSLKSTAHSMRYNFLLKTKELLQTDRAAMAGTLETYGAYTGGLVNWRNNHPLTSAISWDVPHTNFGALVRSANERYVRVWVYNFEDETTRMGVKHWLLEPGKYEVLHGPILEGETGQGNLRYGWKEPETFIYERKADTHYVDVPPGEAYAIDFRLVEPMEVDPIVPDLAIHERDIVLEMDENGEPEQATVTVHNVGMETARRVVVSLQKRTDNGFEEIDRETIRSLESPDDLVPRRAHLEFDDGEVLEAMKAGHFRVVLDPEDAIDEIYEGNNMAVFGEQSVVEKPGAATQPAG